jgi:hypothetical protein
LNAQLALPKCTSSLGNRDDDNELFNRLEMS